MTRRAKTNAGSRADIEQEVNGLYSFDRKPKLDVRAVKAIIDKVHETYNSKRP